MFLFSMVNPNSSRYLIVGFKFKIFKECPTKLNFMSMNKCKGGKVLDIGCNEGFLSTQAALHGAESVYGFDITEQDIALAKDIQNKILKLNNIEFGV